MPVTDVVDLATALTATPTTPKDLSVSFDEPPLARRGGEQNSPLPASGPGIVQATYVGRSPGGLEQAPMPRSLPGRRALPLSSPADPF